MATFRYTALNGSGQRVEGVLAGAHEQAVLSELETRQLTPMSVEQQEEAAQARRRIPGRKLGEAYGQLSDLLAAGVPLLRGLKLLAGRKSQSRLAGVFRELADAVAGGSDLGAAMGNMPGVFPPVHVAMVKAGEKGGFLESVLAKLGSLVIGQAEIRSKIIGNLVYPTVLVVLGTAILGVIFGVFVPKFRPIFEKIPGGLPLVTRFVFGLSDLLGRYGLWTAVVLGLLAYGAWRLSKRAHVRVWVAERIARLPIVGPLTGAIATSRFCQLLGTMLASGVPMIAAMQIAREGAGHVLLERGIEKATEAVRAGQALTPPLAESGVMEDDVVEMIAVGESANNLDDVLVRIAATLESRVDRMLGVAIRLIEPLLLLLLAGVVMIVAAALLLPMTKLSQAV